MIQSADRQSYEKGNANRKAGRMTSQQAITLMRNLWQSLDDYCELNDEGKTAFRMAITALELFGNSEQLPSAQPEIIRCRNCKFASGDSRICMKFGHGPIGELDFCAWAERGTDEE